MKELYDIKWYSISELSKMLGIPVSFISSHCNWLDLLEFTNNNNIGVPKLKLNFEYISRLPKIQYIYKYEWRMRHIPETEINKIEKLYSNRRTPEKVSAMRIKRVLRLYEALTDEEKFKFVDKTPGLMTVPIYNYEEENYKNEQEK